MITPNARMNCLLIAVLLQVLPSSLCAQTYKIYKSIQTDIYDVQLVHPTRYACINKVENAAGSEISRHEVGFKIITIPDGEMTERYFKLGKFMLENRSIFIGGSPLKKRDDGSEYVSVSCSLKYYDQENSVAKLMLNQSDATYGVETIRGTDYRTITITRMLYVLLNYDLKRDTVTDHAVIDIPIHYGQGYIDSMIDRNTNSIVFYSQQYRGGARVMAMYRFSITGPLTCNESVLTLVDRAENHRKRGTALKIYPSDDLSRFACFEYCDQAGEEEYKKMTVPPWALVYDAVERNTIAIDRMTTVYSVQYDRSLQYLYAASCDGGMVRRISLTTGKTVASRSGFGYIHRLFISPDNKYLTVVARGRSISILEIPSLKTARIIPVNDVFGIPEIAPQDTSIQTADRNYYLQNGFDKDGAQHNNGLLLIMDTGASAGNSVRSR